MRANATLEAKQKEASYTPSLRVEVGGTQRQYLNAGDDSSGGIYGNIWWVAQTFTPAATHTIWEVKVKAYRYYSPGKLTVSIRYTDINGHPISSDIGSGTYDCNEITTASTGVWISIPITPVAVTAGTKYAIVLRALEGDVNNQVVLRFIIAGGYANGNGETSTDGGVSWTAQSYDLMFEEWSYTLLATTIGSAATIRDIEYTQEPYGSVATILLNNSKADFSSLDLRNQVLKIGYGAMCSGVPEISYPPYLWVEGTELTSEPGKAEFVIYAIGAWNKLKKWIADDNYIFNPLENLTKTIKELIDWLCVKAGIDLGADTHGKATWAASTPYSLTNMVVPSTYNGYEYECTTAGTSGATEPSWPLIIGNTVADGSVVWTCRTMLDGKVDSWQPHILITKGESGFEVAKTLLELCRCVLRPDGDDLKLKYNQDADAVDYTYYSAETHYFRISRSQSRLFSPMKVKATTFDPANGTFTGEYAHADWVAEMGILEVDYSEPAILTSNADCAWLAQSLVERAESQGEQGLIRAPINCLQEIYDKVTISDTRDGTSATGRVGGLYARYIAQTGLYELEVRLGGLQRHLPLNMQEFVDDMGLAGVGPVIPGRLIRQHSIPPASLLQAMQPYAVDLDFYAKDDDEIYWNKGGAGNAGLITFADGTQITINEKTLAIPLLLTATHFLYFDLEDGSPQDLSITTTYSDCFSSKRGFVAIVVKASAADQKALILPFSGKVPTLNATVLTANMILAGHIRAGELVLGGKVTGVLDNVGDGTTYHKVLATHISAGKIKLLDATVVDATFTQDKVGDGTTFARVLSTHLDAGKIKLISTTTVDVGFTIDKVGEGATNKYFSGKNLDDLGNGVTYGRVAVTDISAGKIVLTVRQILSGAFDIVTAVSGTRVEISASHIAGYLLGVPDVLQFEIRATDGKAYFGAGVCVLDAGGITIQGQTLTLKDSNGANTGYIYVSTAGDLVLAPVAGAPVYALGEGLQIASDKFFGVANAAVKRLFFNCDQYFGGLANLVNHIFSPSVAGSGSIGRGHIGDNTYWWQTMYSQYYYYKTAPASFQGHDDVGLIRSMREHLTAKNSMGNPTLDMATLPAGVKSKGRNDQDEEVEFIDNSALTGLLIGAIKQLADKVDALEARLP